MIPHHRRAHTAVRGADARGLGIAAALIAAICQDVRASGGRHVRGLSYSMLVYASIVHQPCS